jgi:polar amino acid transport system substrate-binding protein
MLGRTLSRTSRRGFLFAVALASALPLIAAGAASARTVEEAKAAGTVVVGIQGDNQPWGFIDASGVQSGFDADIAKAFGEYLGVDVTFAPLAVANRIPALATGKVDVLFATMAMTEERAQSIQYSQPYAANAIYLVGSKDAAIAGPEDLSGMSVGVPRSSTMDTAVTAVAPADTEILRFDDDAANIQALLSGQVDTVGANQFYMQRLETASAGTYENKFELVRSHNGAGSRLGEKDWNEALNAFLDAFMATPEYAAIYEKWIGVEVPEFPESIPNIPFTVQ